MRLQISATADRDCYIPFNYNYKLQSAIYHLIEKSSSDYSEFLHSEGFKLEKPGSRDDLPTRILKQYKLFTFSKLRLPGSIITKVGFQKVRQIEFIFSTNVPQSFEHIVYGIFTDQSFFLRFREQPITFDIVQVQSLPEPIFDSEMRFLCLSPITISTQRETGQEDKLEQHYLDYLNSEEKEKFCHNVQQNLIRKYETYHETEYTKQNNFEFAFDPDYIIKHKGRISKLIHFKNGVKIKAFEAPFRITADPDLIRIGYQCGFGEKNSAGFGCVKVLG